MNEEWKNGKEETEKKWKNNNNGLAALVPVLDLAMSWPTNVKSVF